MGVASVLEGSVQRIDNNIRITAQLIDANTQQNIWAEKYDRSIDEVFVIQRAVSQQIESQLNAGELALKKGRSKKKQRRILQPMMIT